MSLSPSAVIVTLEKTEIRSRKHLTSHLSLLTSLRGRSSVGRAPALHAGGQGFESPRLHQRPASPEADHEG